VNALQHLSRLDDRDIFFWNGSVTETTLIVFPKPYSVCAFFLDDTDWSSDELSEAIRAVIGAGGVFLLFHGRRCQDAHDLADRVILERNPDESTDNVIMTTWHDREKLLEVVGFALVAAIPASNYIDLCKSTVFISLANSKINAALIELLAHPVRTIHQWSAREPGDESRRDQLKRKYRKVFSELTSILAKHDPIGIYFGQVNPDEYEPEVGTIIPRLRDAQSETDCARIIHEEFVSWFGEETVGPGADYRKIAHDVWEAWSKFSSGSTGPVG
jgi:hypothetical protein